MRAEEYIGYRINELCEKLGISRYRLSQLSGIAQSTLTQIVKGNTIPTLLTLERICNGFNISISDFFAGNAKYLNDLTEMEKEHLKLWNQLDIQEKDFIDISIKALLHKKE